MLSLAKGGELNVRLVGNENLRDLRRETLAIRFEPAARTVLFWATACVTGPCSSKVGKGAYGGPPDDRVASTGFVILAQRATRQVPQSSVGRQRYPITSALSRHQSGNPSYTSFRS